MARKSEQWSKFLKDYGQNFKLSSNYNASFWSPRLKSWVYFFWLFGQLFGLTVKLVFFIFHYHICPSLLSLSTNPIPINLYRTKFSTKQWLLAKNSIWEHSEKTRNVFLGTLQKKKNHFAKSLKVCRKCSQILFTTFCFKFLFWFFTKITLQLLKNEPQRASKFKFRKLFFF